MATSLPAKNHADRVNGNPRASVSRTAAGCNYQWDIAWCHDFSDTVRLVIHYKFRHEFHLNLVKLFKSACLIGDDD